MSDNRQVKEEYATIGEELIRTEECLIDILNSQARIVYLVSDYAKTDRGMVVYGQCERVADKYKWGISADFTITLFSPNIKGKSEEAIKRIIFHELLHVGIEFKEDGTEKYTIVPHDIEDFKLLIDRWGTDWSNV